MRMSRPYGPARGLPAAVLAAVGFLATGCSGSGGDDAVAPSPDTSATAPATPSPSTPSTPVTAPTTLSAVYPTGPAGCHADHAWSATQAAEWLKFEQLGSPTWMDGRWGHVHFAKSKPGFDGPLCDAVTVQVQYWKVTYRAAGNASVGGGGTQRYVFTTASLARTRLRVDGRSVKDVYAPKSVASAAASPCVGYLVAIYIGGPLTEREMATDISTGGLVGQTISFPTKRVADSRFAEPSAPQRCDASGRPVPEGRPGVPGLLPTPGLPHITVKPKSP